VIEVDDDVLAGFLVAVAGVVERLAVQGQERLRHVHAVRPQLSDLAGGVEHPTIGGAGVGREAATQLLGRGPVLRLPGFGVEQGEHLPGAHRVQVAEAVGDPAVGDEPVVPGEDVVEVAFLAGALVHQVLPVEVQTTGVAPAAESGRDADPPSVGIPTSSGGDRVAGCFLRENVYSPAPETVKHRSDVLCHISDI
jgi:hypothetical protein